MRKPLISIIIPLYNGEKTIAQCLESAYNSNYKNFEVIVVDDASTDNSVKIAERFPCKIIKLRGRKGPAFARNVGAKHAKGKILYFADSDVMIDKKNLNTIVESFKNNPRVSAIQGIYAEESIPKNIVTQYRACYCNYKYSKISQKFISTLNSYCFAIKSEVFKGVEGFDQNLSRATVEDVELGYRLKNLNYKILFKKELKVTHLKFYSLRGLLVKDFIKIFDLIKLALRNRKKFANNQTPKREGLPISMSKRGEMLDIIFSVFLSPLILLNFIVLSFLYNEILLLSFLLLCFAFIFTGLKFFNFIRVGRGLKFCLNCIFIYYLEMLVVSFALILGFFDYMLLNKKC
jgi:glycosyltransferase involved in cell wall biosynthesis